ncbi:MAG: amidohydrolase [Bdellovibrionales bacterium]|nr:amidohydrolase [Bdellovibrionales bacterium]
MSRFDLGIRCDWFLGMAGGDARVERNWFVGVKDGRIETVGPWKEPLRRSAKKFHHQPNHVVMPGLVNGHTHLPMTLFRGIEDDAPLRTWLFERIFPLEAKLVGRGFVRLGAELAALECIRFGVTTVNDMYFYVDEVARVIDRAGLRACLGQTFLDFPTPEDKDLGSDKTALFEGLVKKWGRHPRIRITLAPHAPYTVGDDRFREVVRLSEKYGAMIHLHLNETESEIAEHLRKFGLSPVERLGKLGVFCPRTVCAHGVHMTEEDHAALRAAGASVIYNPDSNMKLSSGVAPVPRYLRDGVAVAIGTDGSASKNDLSLFAAMNVGTKLQKVANHDNTAMTAVDALRLATWLGARAIGLGDVCGSLAPGKRADLIFVDMGYPHLQPVNSVVSHLVYAVQGLEVSTVICDGKVLMKDRKVLTLRAEKIFRGAAAMARRISRELAEMR